MSDSVQQALHFNQDMGRRYTDIVTNQIHALLANHNNDIVHAALNFSNVLVHDVDGALKRQRHEMQSTHDQAKTTPAQ